MVLSEISAAEQIGFPILSLVIFLPVIAAIIAMWLQQRAAMLLAIVVSIVELLLTCYIWWLHDPSSPALQFTERLNIGAFDYSLGIDGISVMFLPATALLSLFAVLYAAKSVSQNVSSYISMLLICEAALIGAFAASNLALFWLFFIAEIIPSYYLIKHWGEGEEKNEVARTYMVYMTISTIALGVGFLMLASNLDVGFSLDYVTLANGAINSEVQTAIFLVLSIAIAIKAPLVPLHSWLPKVLEHGPIIGMSVFFVGIKLGAYALIKFVIPLLPAATAEWFWVMAIVGVISLVYGALIALVQTNLRQLLAYASVSHMGVVTLGLFSLNVTGIEGGILQALNLGITGAGLFLISSFLSSRLASTDFTKMGGLYSHAPYMALGFLIIALAAVGMPGTSGFNGEHLVLLGAFERHWLMAIGVGIGPILAAAYFLRFYQSAFLGEPFGDGKTTITDLNGQEKFMVASLVGVVLWVGLYTTPFLSTMRSNIEMISDEFGSEKISHAEFLIQGKPKTNTITSTLIVSNSTNVHKAAINWEEK